MASLFRQLTILITSIIVIALIWGGIRIVQEVRTDSSQKEARIQEAQRRAAQIPSAEQILVELNQARAAVRVEVERLNVLMTSPRSPEALAIMREEVYQDVSGSILARADAVLKDITATKGTVATVAQTKLQIQIAEDRAHIQEVLTEWKELIQNPTSSGGSSAAQQQYANEIKTYIKELQELVTTLTPENSGLTPQEIADDKAAVAAAIKEADQAIAALGSPSVPPAVVQQQQDVVADAQHQVENLQQQLDQINNPSSSGTGETSSPTTGGNTDTQQDTTPPTNPSSPSSPHVDPEPQQPGTRYVPPPVVDDPNKPHLIEGANTDN
mgnify:CR=1 FL=1